MGFLRSRIDAYKNRIWNNSFIKSIAALSSGAIISQGILFAGTPLLGRVFSPSDIGEYTLITTISNTICAVGNLGLMTSFMLPRSNIESRRLCKLVMLTTASFSFLVCLALFFCKKWYRIDNESDSPYAVVVIVLWLVGITVTLYNICISYSNRFKRYKVMFRSQILCAIINVSISLCLGIAGFGFVGYTIGSVLSYLLASGYMMLHGNPFHIDKGNPGLYIKLFKDYKHFPMYSMPANIVGMISDQINVQTLRIAFSASILGMYSMALKVISIPATLIAAPINKVFYREASERYNNGEEIGPMTYSLIKWGMIIALVPILLLTFLGEPVFSFFIGERWAEAGRYASILGIYTIMRFIEYAVSGAFIIIRRNKWNLYLRLYDLSTAFFIMLIALFWEKNIYGILVFMTLFRVIRTLFFVGTFLNIAGSSMFGFVRTVFLYSIIPIVIAWSVKWLIYYVR